MSDDSEKNTAKQCFKFQSRKYCETIENSARKKHTQQNLQARWVLRSGRGERFKDQIVFLLDERKYNITIYILDEFEASDVY